MPFVINSPNQWLSKVEQVMIYDFNSASTEEANGKHR